jgi:dimethylargininase
VKALVRGIPDSFSLALAAVVPDPPIDVALARDQHLAYRAALEDLGLAVTMVDAREELPDCCFVEDTAVVAAGVALITRPGAASRRAEPEGVEAALEGVEVVRMRAPGTLDGGDVLRLGTTFYVGRSARTNLEGLAQLEEVFVPRGFKVLSVALPPGVLHLKSVCSPLGDGRVLLAEGTVPPSILGGADVVLVPAADAPSANCVSLGRHAIVAEEFPRTVELLRKERFFVHPVPTTEVRKADGALTCQSIIYQPAAPSRRAGRG